MKKFVQLVLPVLLLAMSTPPAFASDELDDLVRPDEASFAVAQHAIAPVIDKLIAGDSRGAFETAFARSPMFERIKSQLPQLSAQLAVAYETYGPINHCQAVQRGSLGSMYIRYIYLCQHDNFLTRWDFKVSETKNGWVISNVSFSDTF